MNPYSPWHEIQKAHDSGFWYGLFVGATLTLGAADIILFGAMWVTR